MTQTDKEIDLNKQNEFKNKSEKLKNSNKTLLTNNSLDIIPSVNFLPDFVNQNENINKAFSSSTRSIHPINLNNKISSNSLHLAPHALIESSHHVYPKVIPPKIKHHKSEKKPGFFKTKILNDPKNFLYFKLFLILIGILLLSGLGLIIFAAIKPCSLTRCHKKASLCINRFPFWSQCICDYGYTGNGKTYCDECGLSNVSSNLQRVVGGVESVKSSWPFAVYLIQNYKGRYNIKGSNYIISYSWSCGGTILNHKTILTAAHCIHEKNFEYQDADNNYYTLEIQSNEWYNDLESTFEIYVGLHDIRYLNRSKKVKAKKIIKHEDYDEFNLKNDIALIQIETIMEMSNDIQYACLPYKETINYPQVNQQAYVIGWGRTSEKGPGSNVLKNSKIEIFNPEQCAKVETKIDKNWDSQICAGVLDGSTDTCQGDSGGGLFIKEVNSSRFFVTGVVSYGEGCARIGKPGIYSRTSYFLEWIRKNSDF